MGLFVKVWAGGRGVDVSCCSHPGPPGLKKVPKALSKSRRKNPVRITKRTRDPRAKGTGGLRQGCREEAWDEEGEKGRLWPRPMDHTSKRETV